MTTMYKLISAQVAIPVVVHYTFVEDGIGGESRMTIGYVDYGRDRVYFPDAPVLGEDMERAVLASLDPKSIFVPPTVPTDVLAEADEIRRKNTSETLKRFWWEENTIG